MKRSKFNLSFFRNFTANMGELVPVGYTEVLPGDTMQLATSLLVRMSPLLTPVMHPVHVRVHHWFVPYRLLWASGIDDSWEAFITGGHDGMDASSFPQISFNNAAVGTLADYFSVTPLVASARLVSAMPFRAYALIYNECYRDQDLQTALTIDLTGGTDTTTNVTLQKCDWEKDYYTSARPWTQKGPAVSLPLGTSATVKAAASPLLSGAQNPMKVKFSGSGDDPDANRWYQTGSGGDANQMFETAATAGGAGGTGIYPSNLFADLSSATSATINELREALAIQRYEEARARYGSRYTEYLRYLGVKSSDARLQRPEYLGGGKQTIQFSEVLQTSPTTSGTPNTGVGSLLGHGIGATRSNRFRRFFEEHGAVVSLMSVLPKTMYVNGTPKHLIKTAKEEFWQKELQHIGQQEILNKETYAAHSAPTGVFGYQDRYDEYRRNESSVHGDFRTTLNMWHLGRIFAGDTTLNASFVEADPATRIFQSAAADTLWVMCYHSMQARRMVAREGTSSIL